MKKNRLLLTASVVLGINTILLVVLLVQFTGRNRAEQLWGPVIFETTSEFSHIRVRERDRIRSLLFVDEDGAEQRQSAINVDTPHDLQLRYSKSIFVSHLFRHPQERVLIVGLGGGGMVRFLNHAFPDTAVAAVEIDPAVVQAADEFFDVRTENQTTIHTADAFQFLREEQGPYDVIYMDAFLKPTVDPKLADVPQRLKTVEFLRDIQARLKPEGLLAFNLIESHDSTEDDLAAIREAFPTVYLFSVPQSGNMVVVASLSETLLDRDALAKRAAEMPAEAQAQLPFAEIVGALR